MPSNTSTANLLPISFRNHESADVGFISKSFILGLRATPAIQSQLGDVAWPRLQFLFEEMWYNPKVAWVVACDPTHPSFIHGYIVGERVQTVEGQDRLVVHFTYVRQVSRRFGVARRLLERLNTAQQSPILYSTITPTGREILRKRIGFGIYDPWYLWGHVKPAEVRAVDQAMQRARKHVATVTDRMFESKTTQALGYVDPNPTLSTPTEDPAFADEFRQMARDARRGK